VNKYKTVTKGLKLHYLSILYVNSIKSILIDQRIRIKYILYELVCAAFKVTSTLLM